MKYLVKFFVVTLVILICTHASAEQNIAYIDMKIILNESKAGKGAQDYLKKSFTILDLYDLLKRDRQIHLSPQRKDYL